MPQSSTITVAPGPSLKPGQIAIWEVNREHPGGEISLAAPHEGEEAQSIDVAMTAEVSKRLADGRLVEVRRSRRSAPEPTPFQAHTTPAPAATNDSDQGGQAPADPLAAPGLLTDAQREALATAGYRTAADIRRASDDDLIGVPGIGPTTAARLRAAVKE